MTRRFNAKTLMFGRGIRLYIGKHLSKAGQRIVFTKSMSMRRGTYRDPHPHSRKLYRIRHEAIL